MPARAWRRPVACPRDDGQVILPATLVVLAGGDSRRMGRPKALLPVAGTTLIEWLTARLSPGFAHLVVAARDPERVPASLRRHVAPDLHAGAGPLAGVEAGLAASPHDVVVAVACDMPAVTPDLLRRLHDAAAGADAAVPRIAGRPEPACAAYRRPAARPIARALAAGRLRATDVLVDLGVRWLDGEDPALFANLNTPADYARFLDEYVHVPPTEREPHAPRRDPA
ncbi:MAG: molybdenum cofactor guanylyltransferase [Chloroflexi bacterium]|nr:MAG: molybdenum cofactor guanylyltransferase [Chloroflexota bacterium]